MSVCVCTLQVISTKTSQVADQGEICLHLLSCLFIIADQGEINVWILKTGKPIIYTQLDLFFTIIKGTTLQMSYIK